MAEKDQGPRHALLHSIHAPNESMPIDRNASVYLFLSNLSRYLYGDFSIVFFGEKPEVLTPSSWGTMRLETWSGEEFLLSVGNVRFGTVMNFATVWGMKRVSDTRFRHRRAEDEEPASS